MDLDAITHRRHQTEGEHVQTSPTKLWKIGCSLNNFSFILFFMSVYQCIMQLSFLQVKALPLWALRIQGSRPTPDSARALPPPLGAESWCYQKDLAFAGLTSWFSSNFCIYSLCGLGWVSHLPKPQFPPLSYEENKIENVERMIGSA